MPRIVLVRMFMPREGTERDETKAFASILRYAMQGKGEATIHSASVDVNAWVQRATLSHIEVIDLMLFTITMAGLISFL